MYCCAAAGSRRRACAIGLAQIPEPTLQRAEPVSPDQLADQLMRGDVRILPLWPEAWIRSLCWTEPSPPQWPPGSDLRCSPSRLSQDGPAIKSLKMIHIDEIIKYFDCVYSLHGIDTYFLYSLGFTSSWNTWQSVIYFWHFDFESIIISVVSIKSPIDTKFHRIIISQKKNSIN